MNDTGSDVVASPPHSAPSSSLLPSTAVMTELPLSNPPTSSTASALPPPPSSRRRRRHRPPVSSAPSSSSSSPAPVQSCGVSVRYVLTCDGLRHVVPYHFQHRVNAKHRWYGRPVLAVFSAEFSHPDPSYYLSAIDSQLITLNGQPCTAESRVKSSDVICHTLHRHEPPVSSTSPCVIHQDQHIVVVDKPSSIAIHPCGKYWHNTLLGILRHEGYGELYPIHRLDRWTSGLTLLARDATTAATWSTQLKDQLFHKTYLARVKGQFPEELTVDAPILCTSQQRGSHVVNEKGKTAVTRFRRLSYNGHTSVVECSPLTGRTHQIRLHLLHVGHAILNDPLYGGQLYQHNSYQSDLQSGEQGEVWQAVQEEMDAEEKETEEDDATRDVRRRIREQCIDCKRSQRDA